MSLINTGDYRCKTLVVTKFNRKNIAKGYPKQYHITNAFTQTENSIHRSYGAITVSELAALTAEQYRARLAAFIFYVETIEQGLSVKTTDAYGEYSPDVPITDEYDDTNEKGGEEDTSKDDNTTNDNNEDDKGDTTSDERHNSNNNGGCCQHCNFYNSNE